MRTARQPPWRHAIHLPRRTYTTALAENQQHGPAHFAEKGQTAADTQYVDFVVAGYGEALRGANARNVNSHKAKARNAKTRNATRVVSRKQMTGSQSGGKSSSGARPGKHPAKTIRGGRAQPRNPPYGTVAGARQGARYKSLTQNGGLRQRFQSIRSDVRTSAVFSSAWNTRFLSLARRYDRRLPQYYLQEPEIPVFHPVTVEWVDTVLEQMRRGDELAIEALARRYGKIGREVWSEVALWLLYHQEDSMLDFLEATHVPLYPPINWVEDCLSYLARHYNADTKPNWLQQLIRVFMQIVDRQTNEQYIFNSTFFQPLLPHCTVNQANELYRTIKLGKVKVTGHTLLHFADYFAKQDHVEQSLDALLEAKAAGADVDSVPYRSGCSTLLRKSIQHPGGMRICLRLIENMVSVGVNLNRNLCNVVMLNAVEIGDLDTADAVHRSALEQGFAPDVYTCAIRLKACKIDISNVQRLTATIEEAIASGEVRKNAVVATEIMHCLALHHTQEYNETTSAFPTLATAYMQLFDPAPLERLGVEMPEEDRLHAGKAAEPRMTPTPHVIAFLVMAYLRHNTTPDDAERLYTRWRQLVITGDKPLAACAATPDLPNIFLRRFTRVKSKLLQAARVVQDMQKPLPDSAGVEQAKPDLYTWSIFLHGFASKGETKLAEQVLRYMRNKRIEPNHVTWTSLIGGYAAAQNFEGTLETCRRMQQSGVVWNEWTERGLRRFRDKQKLKALLEEQRLQQNLDFSSELKEGLAGKLGEPADGAQESSTTETSPREARPHVARATVEGTADSAPELTETLGSINHV